MLQPFRMPRHQEFTATLKVDSFLCKGKCRYMTIPGKLIGEQDGELVTAATKRPRTPAPWDNNNYIAGGT